jgi:predicted RNase H-like HicB family nuclease
MKEGNAMRQVFVYPGENGYYVAECPSLPGCISQGRTKEEALANIKEAIQVYADTFLDQRIPVPADRFDSMLVGNGSMAFFDDAGQLDQIESIKYIFETPHRGNQPPDDRPALPRATRLGQCNSTLSGDRRGSPFLLNE